MDRAPLRQGEREGAEPGEQINSRTPRPYAGEDLFDQDCFGRLTRLYKSSGRERRSDPGQQDPHWTPLDDRNLIASREPDDACEIAFLGKPGQRFERAELRPIRRLDQEVYTTVCAGQTHFSVSAQRENVPAELTKRLRHREQWSFHNEAFTQIDHGVSVAFAKPDPQRKTLIVRTREPKPHAPPPWRHDPQRANEARIYLDPLKGGR